MNGSKIIDATLNEREFEEIVEKQRLRELQDLREHAMWYLSNFARAGSTIVINGKELLIYQAYETYKAEDDIAYEEREPLWE